MSQLTFAPIPNEILRRTDLSPGAKLCCARLIQYAGKDGQAFPKLATLGEELGFSSRNVQRFIAELESHKLVTTQQRGRGQSNIYHVDKSILIHNPKLTTTDLSTLNRTDSSTLDTTDSSTPYKGRKENFKKEIEKITAGLVHNMRMPR
jgi:hypothetical protein